MSIYRRYLGVDDTSILMYRQYLSGGRYFDIDITQDIEISPIDMGRSITRPPLGVREAIKT